MDLTDLITPDAVVGNVKVGSKKQLIQDLSARAAALTGLPERVVFDALLQRERLGSTGVGHGIAIPHGKFVELDSIIGMFARLAKPIDFEALDDQPVDLVFLLMAPEGAGADHLKALARVARVLRDPATTEKLRATSDPAALYTLLAGPEADAA